MGPIPRRLLALVPALILAPVLATFASGATAQQIVPSPQQAALSTGAVTGRVSCIDTNLPARLADVTLEPVRDVAIPLSGSSTRKTAALSLVQTGLDGSFTFPRVVPGTYYVIVQQVGYLSPVTQFFHTDFEDPTPEMAKLIAASIPTVTVEPGHTSAIEVRLQRGASISGVVRFDDGSLAAGQEISLLRRAHDGKKWVGVRILGTGRTDDLGQYRISGLPPAEYLVQISLDIRETMVDQVFGSNFSLSSHGRYSLPVFSGGATRQRDAQPIKLTENEDHSGEDIVIPLSKLHPLTGTIVDARSGHIVNAGHVAVAYADDNSQLFSTTIDENDSTFHFAFIPEGSYILRASSVRDVIREEIPGKPGSIPPYTTKETTIQQYNTAEQPLLIEGEPGPVTLKVAAKAKQNSAPE